MSFTATIKPDMLFTSRLLHELCPNSPFVNGKLLETGVKTVHRHSALTHGTIRLNIIYKFPLKCNTNGISWLHNT